MRLCSTNPGKMREFGGLLAPLGINLIPTMGHDIPETGDTFLDNAIQKAQGYAKLYPNEWLLSEDSGLVIPALNGSPGVISARYSDPMETLPREIRDPQNNALVLANMKDVPPHLRGAYFVACVVVVGPGGEIAFKTEHRAYGSIVSGEGRGTNGFGYDPIFESPNSFGKTWAEIDSARKDLISHRSAAMWALQAWLCSTKCEVV